MIIDDLSRRVLMNIKKNKLVNCDNVFLFNGAILKNEKVVGVQSMVTRFSDKIMNCDEIFKNKSPNFL